MAVITFRSQKSKSRKKRWPLFSKSTMQATVSGDGESHFSNTFPLTYERLKRSVARRHNALKAFPTSDKELWQHLMVAHMEAKHRDPHVQPLSPQEKVTVQSAGHYDDEFGIDCLHLIEHKAGSSTFQLLVIPNATASPLVNNSKTIPLKITALRDDHNDNSTPRLLMEPLDVCSVPFQNAVLLLLRNRQNQSRRELLWIPTDPSPLPTSPLAPVELSYWALNHNTFAEHPGDFQAPPFLHGDASLVHNTIMMAATEGRTDIANVHTALTAVALRQRDVLLFDQIHQKQKQKQQPKHWRMLVTCELFEPRRIPVSAMCIVLDALLLYASHDGALRAHPRGNPRSTYHVEDLQTLVVHMTSLYNVVAMLHSHSMLEVRRVHNHATDPFVRFDTLYQCNDADATHKPLLYGPYLLYASLDGHWYRVLYDTPALSSHTSNKKTKTLIKLPHKANWKLVSIKRANWRYMIVTLLAPTTSTTPQEFLVTL